MGGFANVSLLCFLASSITFTESNANEERNGFGFISLIRFKTIRRKAHKHSRKKKVKNKYLKVVDLGIEIEAIVAETVRIGDGKNWRIVGHSSFRVVCRSSNGVLRYGKCFNGGNWVKGSKTKTMAVGRVWGSFNSMQRQRVVYCISLSTSLTSFFPLYLYVSNFTLYIQYKGISLLIFKDFLTNTFR